MLTAALTHGFAPDPMLPQRDVLLDADAVADRLAAMLGPTGPTEITSCALVRSKYRIGESLRVVYRLEINGTERLVSARAFRPGASESAYVRAVGSTVAVGTLVPVVHDAELDAVWWMFPNDRRLSGLDALLRPTRSMVALLPSPTPWRTSQVVEYAPERSVTMRAHDAVGSTLAYVKAYASGTVDVRALAARYDAVALSLRQRTALVRSPAALGWSVAQGVLLLEAMPGLHWNQIQADGLGAALAHLGAAIATLHRTDRYAGRTPDLAAALRHFGRLDTTRIVHSADLIARARPDVAGAAARLAATLAAGPPLREPSVVLHGDCHPKNALVDGTDIALIDLDQAGIGPAAADIGSLLAQLRHDAVLTGDDRTYRMLADAFLRGYADIRRLPPESSLRWHTAAALLAERTMRAVNPVHVETLVHLDALLDAANATMDSAAIA